MVRDTCLRCARLLPLRYLREHEGDLHCDVCLHVLGVRPLRFVRPYPDQWQLLVYEAMVVATITWEPDGRFVVEAAGKPIGEFSALDAARKAGIDWTIHRYGDT